MLKKIPLSELVPGMYVQKLGKSNTVVQIKNVGWVNAQETIDRMAKQGITDVYIDPDRTRVEKEEKELFGAELPAEPKDYSFEPTVALEVEMERATQLYDEAKSYQSKALKDAAAGRVIDVKTMETVADNLINSIFRNQDALGMLTRIREKDTYLLEHSISVSVLMGIFGKYLKLEKKLIQQACLGGMMHDLGKVRVPEEVLNKPGRLDEQEFNQIKLHPLHGRDIVNETGAKISDVAYGIIINHHEKLNGKGYPFGKPGHELSQIDRMATICDIYDALTADRCYKEGMLPSTALSIISSMAPEELDQELVYRFIRCFTPYPLGTMVRLNNDKLAIVIGHNRNAPTKPKVRTFYSAKSRHHVDPQEINLAKAGSGQQIAVAEKPEKYNLNLANYMF